MNKISRIFVAILALLLLVTTVPAASAAGAEKFAEAGETVTVTLQVNNVWGVDGDIIVSDDAGIIQSKSCTVTSNNPYATCQYFAQTNKFNAYQMELESYNYTVSYTITLKASAQPGQQCKVTFHYETAREDCSMTDFVDQVHVVTVKAPVAPETQPQAPETQPQAPVTQAPVTQAPVTQAPETSKKPVVTTPVTGKPTEPKPPVVENTVDLTELNKQIVNADNLDGSKYTAESWDNLLAALAVARDTLSSKEQSIIDSAAVALSNAIDALVEVNYEKLEAAIEKANAFFEDNNLTNTASKLMEALAAANALLGTNDQVAIDAAAANLEALLTEMEDLIKSLSVTETVIKEIEVEKEVEPKGPFCNIKIHYVWPILFFISLALNLAFIALVVVYIVRRKKEQTDDTPLVDYDIDDAE